MKDKIFHSIEGHTCGNPVRMIVKGAPKLKGNSMNDYRSYFIKNFDWIRTSLMFEPRGHDMMSGSILYPALNKNCDVGILFIETTGCLPMCGHGFIGTITFGLEKKIIKPKKRGIVVAETPAGIVTAEYKKIGNKIKSVKFKNIESWLEIKNFQANLPEIGIVKFDIAYGGNFYAIFDPQKNFPSLNKMTAADVLRISPKVRDAINKLIKPIHPFNKTIKGVTHIMWTGKAKLKNSSSRNAVFYGKNAIDRSPCGTGTSARLAQLHARGKLKLQEKFVHESILGTQFVGRVESEIMFNNKKAIIPSVEGWSIITGESKFIISKRDPFYKGFSII